MSTIIKIFLVIFGSLYAYCTDFIINVANIFHISYYETNFIMFIVMFPLVLIGSIIYYAIQKGRFYNLKSRLKTKSR